MATITTPVYLDDAARTAGEVMTINGGTLTIRTDTRWHANSPASMTGTLGGNCVISDTLGGGLIIDATKVRWMPYTGGSGTVPAIGTTISRGGVTGYLLGVWASATSAPTAVGAAMPATGFLKFREVNNGPFSAGALTGITATASGPDVVGWIEVVADQAANFNVPRLGLFQTRGDWFDLGVTSGSAGQSVQIPTMGSSTNYSPGLWIETGVGTDTYEYWPALASTMFIAGNFGTDIRSKVLLMNTNGSLGIGTGGVGYVPPAGCKIRVPNIFLRQCVTTTRATNAIPHATVATRPDFTTTSAGYIDIEYTYGDWYYLFAQPFYVKLNHVATHDSVNISECASPLDLRDGGTSSSASLSIGSLLLTSCFAGGVVEDWDGRATSAALSGGNCSLNYCIGQTLNRVKGGTYLFARSATKSYSHYIYQSSNITMNDCSNWNGMAFCVTSFGIVINNHDHVDRFVGSTNTTTALYVWTVNTSCVGVKIDGMSFGIKGQIADVHPYSGIVYCAACTTLRFRNFGTRAAFLNGGSVNNPAYILYDGGNNLDLKLQRCYMTPTRTGAHLSNNSSKNILYEDCYGDYGDTIACAGLNMLLRGGGGTNTTTGQASVYGTHFGGAFTSDTAGRMWLALNEPTTETAQYCSQSFSPGSGFTSAGGLSLATAGDYFICEMQENRLQTTGFANTAPVLTGTNTGNHLIEYQLDNGSGWNGVWKTLNGANLSAETIQPNIGYKLKFKITCTVSNNSNLLSYIRCDTTSTLQAQLDNLYPLDTNSVTFTGIPVGTDVVVLAAGTSTILDQKDSTPTSTYTYTYSGAQTVDVGFIKPGYIPYYVRGLTLLEADTSLPIALTPDRNYI